jgi:hypothetical protein
MVVFTQEEVTEKARLLLKQFDVWHFIMLHHFLVAVLTGVALTSAGFASLNTCVAGIMACSFVHAIVNEVRVRVALMTREQKCKELEDLAQHLEKERSDLAKREEQNRKDREDAAERLEEAKKAELLEKKVADANAKAAVAKNCRLNVLLIKFCSREVDYFRKKIAFQTLVNCVSREKAAEKASERAIMKNALHFLWLKCQHDRAVRESDQRIKEHKEAMEKRWGPEALRAWRAKAAVSQVRLGGPRAERRRARYALRTRVRIAAARLDLSTSRRFVGGCPTAGKGRGETVPVRPSFSPPPSSPTASVRSLTMPVWPSGSMMAK